MQSESHLLQPRAIRAVLHRHDPAGQARRNLSQALKGVDPAAVEKETVAGLERARAEFAFHTADCAPSCFFDTAKGHGEYVCNCGEAFASREDWERHVVVAVIDAANEGGER